MESDQETVENSSNNLVSVDLTETDIPGASLEEPLDSQNVAALRWWLLCHGITLCQQKAQLLKYYIIVTYCSYTWHLFQNQRS